MNKFMFIAGPCVIESRQQVLNIAKEIKNIIYKYDIDFYFKASFDKANRTSMDSFRGPGIDIGLDILKEVKDIYGFKIITDIHEPWQAGEVAKIADIIQIPAFLCRQTDLIFAAAKTGKRINIKKAQFLSPQDMKNVVDKFIKCGNDNIMLCERGTMFGYNNLVVDMTSLVEMKKFGYPVIFDATHSVQKPGSNGESSGGNREYVKYLSRAACAIGIDGVFMEVHENPEEALSDGSNMIQLCEVEKILKQMLLYYEITKEIGDE